MKVIDFLFLNNEVNQFMIISLSDTNRRSPFPGSG